MSDICYEISSLLCQVLAGVPIGTNLGLFHLFWALLAGRFLISRGAIFAGLDDLGLPADAVRRSAAALAYGKWETADLLARWHASVLEQGRFRAHNYEGIRPVAGDLIGFFRPRLHNCPGKHYTSRANKALPAVVLGIIATVGSVDKSRLALPRELVRQQPGETDVQLQRRMLVRLKSVLAPDEAAIIDAGFEIADVLAAGVPHFVMRGPTNFVGRRNTLPLYKGRGAHPKFGEEVRPLARSYKNHTIKATLPDDAARWKDGRYSIRAKIYKDLVLRTEKPGSQTFRCVVIYDPRYQQPLVLLTDLDISAQALWRLYRDRWPVEQVPLSAKQMLGAERAFVFGKESRFRLPEVALLAGNVLSYLAACHRPIATGFWDRCARPTCGRLRRAFARLNFSDLPVPAGQIRKKNSETGHLPKGANAHRRAKAAQEPSIDRLAA
jgi:hypothetical protein